jgi:ABC-type antimicrobial peptide transport system permease subunit
VLREGVRRTAVGLVVGSAGTLAASRALRSLLYGVETTDPATYAAVVGVLVAVTLAACLLPAWRATRVDPLVALRAE